MAGFFQQSNWRIGKTTLRDYTHASKTFTTNAYGNAPKFKWLFHVYFDINKTLLTDSIASVFPDDANHGVLVKSIELPKFTIPLTELNQYNRKRYIQTKIQYDPVRVTFHDDNNDLIRHLWYTYYSYYYNDPSQPQELSRQQAAQLINGLATQQNIDAGNQQNIDATALNKTNIYSPDISSEQNWGYLGAINTSATAQSLFISKAPFFKSISIFGFNQHNFSQYQLINPIIENFNHDTYNYYETSGIMENSMSLKYESVKYYSGSLDGQKPDEIVTKFGSNAIYDREISHLSIPRTTSMSLGQGGLVTAPNGESSVWANKTRQPGQQATTFNTNPSLAAAANQQLMEGLLAAVGNPGTERSGTIFPSWGSTTGTGAQNTNSAGQPNTNPPAIPVPANNPISGPS